MSSSEMTDDEIDKFYCVGCEGDQREEFHAGCSYCGNCECQGGC